MAPLTDPSVIEDLAAKKDVAGLLSAAAEESPRIRWAAVRALADHIADPAVVPALIDSLSDADQFVRRAAADGIAQSGAVEALPPLVDLLKDADPFARRSALEAIEAIGCPDHQIAVGALKDPFPGVRQAALRILAASGEDWSLEHLLNALADPDQTVRKTALQQLAALGDPVIDPLIAALEDERWIMRQFAALALAEMRNPRAVDPLIEALSDREAVVREIAARALGQIGDPRAKEALNAVAEGDYDRSVRRSATKARDRL